MTRRELADKVTDLEARVEGLENLLAELISDGRIMVTVPIAPELELEQERPSPAYGRES